MVRETVNENILPAVSTYLCPAFRELEIGIQKVKARKTHNLILSNCTAEPRGARIFSLTNIKSLFLFIWKCRRSCLLVIKRGLVVEVSGGPIREDPTVYSSYTAKMEIMSASKFFF